MKKVIFNQLFSVGVKEEQPEYIKKSIIITNQLLYLTVFAVLFPAFIFTKIYFEPVLIIITTGIIASTFAYFLNYIGVYNVSRFLFSILPVTFVSTYNAALAGPGEEAISAASMLTLSFAFIPFVIFDLREKVFLGITTVYSFVLILLFDFHNTLFNLAVDNTIIRTGYLGSVQTAMACIIGFGTMYVLVFINQVAEEKAEALLSDTEGRNKVLNDSQANLEIKLEELSQSRIDEKIRNWITEGLAKFGDIIRSSKDLNILSDEVLSSLVKYMNANQGGIYSVIESSSETYIELKSTYAYDQKKYNEKRIEIGQGLIGQTYKEKSYKYLTKIPNGYVQITSGLGDATPRYLLIVPMIVNDKVEGLIELASFQEIDLYKIEFVERLAEQLAISWSAKKVEETTKRLLEETKVQTKEMQEQEDVMRQSMEELQAIQEDMNRAQKESVAKNVALNNAALVSETDRKGYITYVNQTFCVFSGYSKDELLTQNHNIIRHPDTPKAVFKEMWATLGRGNVWKGRIKNKKKNGDFYWVQASITPVVGRDGKPEKYVAVRFDITDYVLQEEMYLKKIKSLEAAL